jgi:hypothetical protein
VTSEEPEKSQETKAIEPEVVQDDRSLVRPETNSREVTRLMTYREGPIIPEELREYEKLVPGFAKAYLDEVIEGAKHQREIEKEKLQIEKLQVEQDGEIIKTQRDIYFSNQRRSVWGLVAGVFIVFSAIGAATYLGLKGRETTAVAVVGSLAAAAAVMYGTDAYNKGKTKELESKGETKELEPEGERE